MLNTLPEVFREAIVLCDIEGLGYEEIARAVGISVGTVKSRIARGRELLRKRLSDF
jgi:RNA polymerase sigma-70 factor (ECF subfamily)